MKDYAKIVPTVLRCFGVRFEEGIHHRSSR